MTNTKQERKKQKNENQMKKKKSIEVKYYIARTAIHKLCKCFDIFICVLTAILDKLT